MTGTILTIVHRLSQISDQGKLIEAEGVQETHAGNSTVESAAMEQIVDLFGTVRGRLFL